MLTCATRVAPSAVDGDPVLLLLHGRGADERDLLPLAGRLPERFALVCPRAPFPGAQWGYGAGWAWYQFMGSRGPEATSFSRSLDALAELLDGLGALLGFLPGEIVLGGFSQGGTTALGYVLARPGRIRRVAVLSGFLPEHPSVLVMPETVAGLQVFWGHGLSDPAIPFAWGEAGRATLDAVGAEVTARDYPIGHQISPAELGDLSGWLEGA